MSFTGRWYSVVNLWGWRLARRNVRQPTDTLDSCAGTGSRGNKDDSVESQRTGIKSAPRENATCLRFLSRRPNVDRLSANVFSTNDNLDFDFKTFWEPIRFEMTDLECLIMMAEMARDNVSTEFSPPANRQSLFHRSFRLLVYTRVIPLKLISMIIRKKYSLQSDGY